MMTDGYQATLERFAAMVAASPHNLVSRGARAELLTRHIPESLALARLLPAGPGRVLDVGSGGGFPGMVVAIVRPELTVHLLDSTRKKTDFLRDAARTLEVDVTVHAGRAEELAVAPDLAQSFDIVTARAVAPLRKLLPWTLPFLVERGVLYAVKGERWREELDEAAAALHRVGGHVLATPDDIPTPPGADASRVPHVVMIARAR